MASPVEQRAIDYLRQHPGGVSAGCVGAHLWPERDGRINSSNGGGDYAAQMLLGRMRKKGWVYVLYGTGSSQWALTSKAPQ